MMYEREYMRRNPSFYGNFRSQYPALFWVLAINIVAFIVEMLFSRVFQSNAIFDYLSLSLSGLKSGFIWEFFSYSILHAGIFHLFLNMLAIFFVGRFVEAKLEKRNFLILYLMGVLGGAIFWALSTYFLMPSSNAVLCGASAGVLALITFFCLAMPDRPLTFLIFFVIPVSLRPKTMLYILIGFEILSYIYTYGGRFGDIANIAHIGGIAGGAFFYILFNTNFFSGSAISIIKPKSKKMNVSDLKYSVNMVNIEDLKKEANRILDKVAKKGLNSLSEEERNTLKQYREYI